MDDLDALLVDLQASASAHVKSQNSPMVQQKQYHQSTPVKQQQQPYHQEPYHHYPQPQQQLHREQQQPVVDHVMQHRHVIGIGSSRDSVNDSPPPPPIPPHPELEDQYSNEQPDYANGGCYDVDAQPIYEEQSVHQQQQYTFPPPPPPVAQQQPLPPQRQSSSGLGHNLSELDSLLESLNSAQFMAEVEKKNLALMQTTSHPPPTPQQKPPEPKASAASSATKDLDDLMASLSGFHTSPGHEAPPHSSAPPEKPARQLSAGGSRQNSPPKDASPGSAQDTVRAGGKSPSVDRETKSASPSHQPTPPPKPPAPPAAPPKPKPASTLPASGIALDSMLNQLGEEARKQGVNTTPKGHCRTCNKMIMGQVVTAMGNTYHPEHFICSHCEKELGTETFFERDDNPYCEECCHFLFSPKCAYCSGPITGKCMSALDKTWHPEHFFCAHCGLQFGEEEFHEKNQKVFCRRCFFDIFAARCKACNLPITANYVSALEGQWHNECFSCRECLMPFTGGSYFEHDGQPYCEVHYHARRGSLCAGCQKPITGRCITAMGKKFHPEHFVCSFCLKQLNKGTFKEKTEKPYCHACFGKLFG